MPEKDLFRFDASIEDALDAKLKTYDEELKRARIYCVRGQYEKALAIYNAILDEDMENQEAYLGLLRVHSEDFTILEGEEIERDIHTLETLFPDIEDAEYIHYLAKRKEARHSSGPSKKAPSALNDAASLLDEGDVLYGQERYSDAYPYYEKAAKLGEATGYLRMGYLAYYGLGVNRNVDEAISLYGKAVELGNYQAAYLLGLIYLNDLGQEARAFKLFEEGYKKGENRSCAAALGYCYLYGKGTAMDYALSFQLLSIGLEAEPTFACGCLAYLYENGYGTEKNLEKALELYRRAAEYGDEYAKGRVKILTAAGIFSWLANHY